jgi:predicted HNH restriction endonuclease
MRKRGDFHGWCRKCNDRISLEKQTKRKQQCVAYKGGKCSICGYNKYIGALDFHHVDPTKKEFGISQLRTYSFKKLMKELDKCICVCKNCHAEIHGEIGGPTGMG